MRLSRLLPIALMLPVQVAGDTPPVVRVDAFARLDSSRVRETPGVIASRKHSGVFWTHGDSGNESKIVAFDKSGRVLAEVHIDDAPNLDWEDIAADNDGHLYIGDIGDGGHYAVRHIYKIREPDPHQPPKEPIKPLEKIAFRYPDDKRFDIEAMFTASGRLYVIGKSKLPGAPLYHVEQTGGDMARLVKIGVLPGYLVTGADASPDGKRILLASYHGAQILNSANADAIAQAQLHRSISYHFSGRLEGCCFVGDDIVLMGEGGEAFRIRAAEFGADRRFMLE